MVKIREWKDLADVVEWDTLVLGNGASMAVCPQFGYEPLLKAAEKRGFITKQLKRVFEKLHTEDFELVMRALWQTHRVNKILGVEDAEVSKAYSSLRDGLIKTVKEVHPQREHVLRHLDRIGAFMKRFKTVLSLNYDLIVYWAIMEWMNKERNRLKDCFQDGEFPEEWEFLRKPYPGTDGSTLVFYPHGNIALASNLFGEENKLTAKPDESRLLLDVIAETWRDGEMIPLFVSEGKSEQKRQTISRSRYLNIVYREVLPKSGPNIATYGWSFGEQDWHIVKQLFNRRNQSPVKRVAVSVFKGSKPPDVLEGECKQIRQGILETNNKVDIDFFDSASSGCWVH